MRLNLRLLTPSSPVLVIACAGKDSGEHVYCAFDGVVEQERGKQEWTSKT